MPGIKTRCHRSETSDAAHLRQSRPAFLRSRLDVKVGGPNPNTPLFILSPLRVTGPHPLTKRSRPMKPRQMAPMKGMEMRINKREYLITGVIFLSIGLFGIFTNRGESLFVFFIIGVVFLVSGFTRKSTSSPAGRRHS